MQASAVLQTKSAFELEPPLFRALTIRRRRLWFPLVISVMIHCGIISLVTWIGSLPLRRSFDLADYRVERIQLQIDTPLYYPIEREQPKPPKAQATDAASSKALVAAPAEPKAEAAAVAETPPIARPAPRPFELPPSPAPARPGPIIVQPDYLPQAPQLKTPIPSVTSWAQAMPRPARPVRDFVVPGRTEAVPTPAPPKLSSPPVPAVPNRESVPADVNVVLPPVGLTPPKLALPNSTTNPIRVRNEQSEPTPVPPDRTPGLPTNVIALSNDKPPLAVVEIPKGLQNIPPSDTAGGEIRPETQSPGAGGGARQPDARPAATEAGNRLGHPTATENGNPPKDSPGKRPDASPSESGAKTPPETPGPGGAAAPRGTGGTVQPTNGNPSNEAVTRITHPPTGNFDVVLMQSGARDDLPDLRGILAGNPVYLVYLQVGDQKEWVLEFSLPARAKPQNNPYQISIDNEPALSPPYPLTTVVPNHLVGQPRPRPMVLHAFLSGTGAFREIQSPDAKNPLVIELLPFLSQWRFRPAAQNDKPVEVEILLVIPPQN